MHYKDGQEVKLGDLANYPATVYEQGGPTTGKQVMRQGFVVGRFSKAEKCNVVIATPFLRPKGDPAEPGIPLISIDGYTTSADECELVARQTY